MSSKQLTVLCAPMNGQGHINATHGIAEILKDRGHKVVFILDIRFKGKLQKYGFDEEILEVNEKQAVDERAITDEWAEFVLKIKEVYRGKPVDILRKSTIIAFTKMFENNKTNELQYKRIIDKLKPDLIIIDSMIGSPTLTHSGIPWVWLCSAAPLQYFHSDKLPPGFSGLPLNGDTNEWKEFSKIYNQLFSELHNKISEYYRDAGYEPLSSIRGNILHPDSPYLNIYLYPKELDYKELQPLPPNWQRIDGFVRTQNETFTIPESLTQRPGKLIFFSLGSFCSIDYELMARLTGFLAKSEHKFIVSKGPLHDRYELSDNMFGQPFVPQMAVLPLVDLVITHGGNNTVTEAFYFGKPLLVLPVSGDTLDNGQRIAETGLGARLSLYNCTEEELLTTVDKLVNDLELAKRMKAIGERIRSNDHKKVVNELVERIVQK